MEKSHPMIEQKKAYEKPVLRRHGNLKEITALAGKVGSGGGKPSAGLGCTRV